MTTGTANLRSSRSTSLSVPCPRFRVGGATCRLLTWQNSTLGSVRGLALKSVRSAPGANSNLASLALGLQLVSAFASPPNLIQLPSPLPLKGRQLVSTVKSTRTMSGLQFRSSTPCCTLRSKSRPSCATSRGRDCCETSSLSKWLKRPRKRNVISKKSLTTTNWPTSTMHSWRSERLRETLRPRPRSSKRKSLGTFSWLRKRDVRRKTIRGG